MLLHRISSLLCGMGLAVLACKDWQGQTAEPVVRLFNGRDLTGWTTWLVDTRSEDQRQVFTVTNGVLRISGEGLGYLGTREEYSDYRLRVEYRWGLTNWTWGDRVGKARDSGVFLHAIGPEGNSEDGKGAFKAAIECNVFEGATGDFLLIRGRERDGTPLVPHLTAEVAPHRDAENWFTFLPRGRRQKLERWGRVNWRDKSAVWRDETGFRGARDVERPRGEWNRLEIECRDATIAVRLNGVRVNSASEVWPRRGRILLQCEGSEIFFRTVELRPIGKEQGQ